MPKSGCECVSHVPEVKTEMQNRASAKLEACGLLAENHAKANITRRVPRNADSWYTPTGRLRNSVSHTVKGDTAYIGSNLSYAVYNEVGTGIYYPTGRKTPWEYVDDKGVRHQTSGMSAIHFLRDAIAEHKEEYRNLLWNA